MNYLDSKINLEECLNLKDDDKIYQYLFDKSFKLGEEIIKIKQLDYETIYKDDKDMELYCIADHIYYNSAWFENYSSLTRFIRKWNFFIDEYRSSTEYKAEIIVKVYNELINEIEDYQNIKNKIKKEGFNNLDKKYRDGLHDIFCKMLDYKKRKYNKDATLQELIKELVLCYSDYKWMLDETYTILNSKIIYRYTMRDDFWVIHVDNVEYISKLEFTYNFFAENEDNYKNYQQYYEDITLKEGQTLKDLYNEEKEKLRNLFIEMLKFINVEIPEEKYYSNLEALVKKYYPYYYLNFIEINGRCNYSYIDSIHVLKTNYDYFKRTYKNHKEDFERYVKEEEKLLEKSKHDDDIPYDLKWFDDL